MPPGPREHSPSSYRRRPPLGAVRRAASSPASAPLAWPAGAADGRRCLARGPPMRPRRGSAGRGQRPRGTRARRAAGRRSCADRSTALCCRSTATSRGSARPAATRAAGRQRPAGCRPSSSPAMLSSGLAISTTSSPTESSWPKPAAAAGREHVAAADGRCRRTRRHEPQATPSTAAGTRRRPPARTPPTTSVR